MHRTKNDFFIILYTPTINIDSSSDKQRYALFDKKEYHPPQDPFLPYGMSRRGQYY